MLQQCVCLVLIYQIYETFTTEVLSVWMQKMSGGCGLLPGDLRTLQEGIVSLRAFVITYFWIPNWVWSGLLRPYIWRGNLKLPDLKVYINGNEISLISSISAGLSGPVVLLPEKRWLDAWVADRVCDVIQKLIYASLRNAGNVKCHQTPNTCCLLPLRQKKLQQHVCRRTSFPKGARAHFPISGW